MTRNTITIVGLGVSGRGGLTLEAWEHLNAIRELYLLSRLIPIAGELPAELDLISFDALLEADLPVAELRAKLIERLISLAKRDEGVSFGVLGSPSADLDFLQELRTEANSEGLSLALIEGLSLVQGAIKRLEIGDLPGLVTLDCQAVAERLIPPFSPSQPALITGLSSRSLASELKLTLMAAYPDEYPVRLLHSAVESQSQVEALALWEIDYSPFLNAHSCLFIPAREEGTGFEDFQEVIARLRAPDGCPWDREQTHLSLRPYLLEEAYEVLEALDQEDSEHLREELGDLMLQIVLHTQIATENEDFKMSDVLSTISQKLKRRHPHVFGSVTADTADEVIRNWEEIKAAERKHGKADQPKGMLDGLPKALPALVESDKIQDRAKRVGFDWESFEPVVEKVREELNELLEAQTEQEKFDEAGDLLFAAVNVIRWLNVDAEMALRGTNGRFRRRFGYIEAQAAAQGKSLQALSFAEMDALWEAAKRQFAQEDSA